MSNKYNLPPDLCDVVRDNLLLMQDPDNPTVIYEILLEEIEKQFEPALHHPEDADFLRIIQCALILERIKQDVAVEMKILCKECFEPLDDEGICANEQCKQYLVGL